MSWLIALARIYALWVIGALITIPFAYIFAPVFYAVESIPAAVASRILEFGWIIMVIIVIGWLIEDYWPAAAARSDNQAPPSPLQLPDLAPWLQAETIVEDADEQPGALRQPKSLPAPGRD